MGLLILFPLSQELNAALECLDSKGISYDKINPKGRSKKLTYYRLKNKTYLATAGFGSIAYSISAQFYVDLLMPSALICAGTAGSLIDAIPPKDVVIADSILYKTPQGVRNIKTTYNMKKEVFQKDGSIQKNFKIHYASLMSVNEEINSESLKNECLSIGAKVVAFEGVAAAQVAQFNGISFTEMRGISDICNSQTKNDFKKNFSSAIMNLMDVLYNSVIH